MEAAPTIYLVDDDHAVRQALARTLRAEGWSVEQFESADAFMARPPSDDRGCLVLDVSMPGLDGLALQRRLNEERRSIPIVFLTGHGDIPMSVRAIKAGAANFLTKPVDSATLVAALRSAIEEDDRARSSRAEIAELERRLATLTAREREVLAGLVAGKLNKQIAADLGVVEQTVKFHRARVMERMQARTTAELVHFAFRLGFPAKASREAPSGS
jgi:FixJ family two-component response regulator